METVLITGGAGFIGSRVAEQLAGAGHEVVVIDNFNNYYSVDLKQYRWDNLAKYDTIERVKCDITDVSQLRAVFQGRPINIVINLAAMAGVRRSINSPFEYVDTNILGLLNLLEIMKENDVKRLVQASTSSVYAGNEMPFLETLNVNSPISPYAATKLGAEGLCYTYGHLYEMSTSVLRFFTVYGPAGRPDMAPFIFAERILQGLPIVVFGDGYQSRDFTFVDDIARGVSLAALRVSGGHEIFNLGGGVQPVTIIEFIQMLGTHLGRAAEVVFKPAVEGDMLHTSADIEKAKKLLGWSPQVNLDEGLRALSSWHLSKRKP